MKSRESETKLQSFCKRLVVVFPGTGGFGLKAHRSSGSYTERETSSGGQRTNISTWR